MSFQSRAGFMSPRSISKFHPSGVSRMRSTELRCQWDARPRRATPLRGVQCGCESGRWHSIRSRGHGAIRLVKTGALPRRTPTLVHSPCDAAASKYRAKLAASANDLLDLNRGLGQMNGDLVETHPDVKKFGAPD